MPEEIDKSKVMVRARHEGVENEATFTQEAFEEVHSKNGWTLSESAQPASPEQDTVSDTDPETE